MATAVARVACVVELNVVNAPVLAVVDPIGVAWILPAYTAPAIPAPPATVNAPVVVLVAAVVVLSNKRGLPPLYWKRPTSFAEPWPFTANTTSACWLVEINKLPFVLVVPSTYK